MSHPRIHQGRWWQPAPSATVAACSAGKTARPGADIETALEADPRYSRIAGRVSLEEAQAR